MCSFLRSSECKKRHIKRNNLSNGKRISGCETDLQGTAGEISQLSRKAAELMQVQYILRKLLH